MAFRRLKSLRNFIFVVLPYFLPREASGADSHLAPMCFGRYPPIPPSKDQAARVHHDSWGNEGPKETAVFHFAFFFPLPFLLFLYSSPANFRFGFWV